MDNILDRNSDYAHYLWHLHDAGVLALALDGENSIPQYSVTSSVWDDLYDGAVTPSLVALIDNGCTSKHPYLPPVSENADAGGLVEGLDFATHDFGAITRPLASDAAIAGPDECTVDREGSKNHFDAANATDPNFWQRINDFDAATSIAGLNDIIGTLTNTNGVVRAITTYADELATHGTLLSGVIGARMPAELSADPGNAIAYFGVDPRCRILPINTSFRPEFIGLIHALLYALGMGADAICIPRAIYRPEVGDGTVDPHLPNDKRATRIDTDPTLLAEATIFENLLLAIAEQIPVIVAAGNNGFKEATVYPASLADATNGIITVGAVNSRQTLSSYSNTRNVTIYAPSDDAPVWTSEEIRLDKEGRTMHDHVVTQAASEPTDQGDYSTWGVLSTDVPGAFGSEDGGLSTIDQTEYDNGITQRSQFAPFGGTSASSGIAAGVVSLLQTKRRKGGQAAMTGPEMKQHLTAHCPALDATPQGSQIKRLDAKICLDAM